MHNQFDELTKRLAQSVTRRAALKKFGVGLAGMALACFGLRDKANAAKAQPCGTDADCDRGRREICRLGLCVRSCTSNKDYPRGTVCQYGFCG